MEKTEIATTFAKGVNDGDYVIAKMVTGETLLGLLDKETCSINDVALLIPQRKEEDKEDGPKMAFYTIPYGFPLTEDIKGESVSLKYIVKCFMVKDNMAGLVEHYEKIKNGDLNNG
jgi:hypothetical protein